VLPDIASPWIEDEINDDFIMQASTALALAVLCGVAWQMKIRIFG
jgi:hypothetical protein